MLTRFNVFKYVIEDLNKTFIDNRYYDERVDYENLLFFWLFPLVIAIITLIFHVTFISVNLLSFISIYSFTLVLFLVYSIYTSKDSLVNKALLNGRADFKIITKVKQETFVTLYFSLILMITIGILFVIVMSLNISSQLFIRTFIFVINYLFILFLLTDLINMKRIYVLVKYIIDSS